MKKLLLICSLVLSLPALAQSDSIPKTGGATAAYTVPQPVVRLGYLSYDSALKAMPQYAIVQKQMADLREAYQQELSRVEEEFNQKYEAFLEGQRDFPRTILLKRQTELQQLMQHNIDFKAQSLRDLRQAEEDAMKPLRLQLNGVLATLARERGLALVINTDGNACPFIDPTMGQDIQEEVIHLLQDAK